VPKVAPVQKPTRPPKTKRFRRLRRSTGLRPSTLPSLLGADAGGADGFLGLGTSASNDDQFCESPMVSKDVAVRNAIGAVDTGIVPVLWPFSLTPTTAMMALKKCSKLHKVFLAEVGVYPQGPNRHGV
jgi:hypothetical protein